MKNYLLMHKNIVVAGFSLDNSEVTTLFIGKNSWKHLPLPLKKLVHFGSYYITEEKENTLSINEEGACLLEIWLGDRTIPADRSNRHKYIPKGMTALSYMLNAHSCSFTDCYWTKEITENISWDEVKLYNNKRIDRLSVLEKNTELGEIYSNINSTLGGTLEKYWYYSEYKGKKQLMLAKRTYQNEEILNIREIISNKIYEKQGYNNYCKYNYIRNRDGSIVGCKCRAFTSEDNELITVYDLLEEFNETQKSDIYNTIVNRAAAYGANPYEVRNQLDIQTIVDYLITNRDRHQNNIGFIRDPNTLRIKHIAPIFDSGSSIYLEGELPESVLRTTAHNLYNTELECINSISNIGILDTNKLPSNSWVLKELKKANNLSQYRIEKLYKLYKDKVIYIKDLQSNRNKF